MNRGIEGSRNYGVMVDLMGERAEVAGFEMTNLVASNAFQIKEEVAGHGYIKGCAGACASSRTLNSAGGGFADLMKGDARFKTAEKRKQQYDDRAEKARQ